MPEKLQEVSEKFMKKDNPELEDDLRSEYDLRNLRVRKLGSARKNFGGKTVHLESDVAEIFPDSDAVNEALRFLIRIMQQNQLPKNKTKKNDGLNKTKNEIN